MYNLPKAGRRGMMVHEFCKKEGYCVKYIFQFARITAFCLAGEVLAAVLPLPIPASVYGLLLLAAALKFGVLKLDQVRETGLFLTGIFPLLFVQRFLLMFYSMNLGVGLFNLLPIPPLDGYHLFNDLLFKGRFRLNQQVFQIAQIVLLLACFSGVLNNVINVIFDAVEGGVLNLFLLIAGQA